MSGLFPGMRNVFLFVFVVLTLAAAPVFAAKGEQDKKADGGGGDPQPPNIVIMLADDLGYGDLHCYGNPVTRTPNLDHLAEQGIRLTSFIAAPSCIPSRVRLLTGRYRIRTGIWATGANGEDGISAYEITLAEALKKVGYHTGIIGKWHLGHAKEKFLPPYHGFDYWYGLPYSNDYKRPWVQTDVPLRLYKGTEPIEYPVNQDTLTTRYTHQAVQFIKRSGDQPFFLYLAYNMPHLPLHTTDRFRGSSRGGLYGDVLKAIDWSAGQVLEALKKTGEADHTIVIFTSDNGPWIDLPPRMLQAGNKPWHVGMKGPLRGSKGSTYEGGVRVPCIIRWPGKIEPGRESPELVTQMDLFVTLIKAAGGQVPQDRPIDGNNLIPFLTGKAEGSPTDSTYYFRGRRLEAVRIGSWKLRLDGKKGPQLFHLGIDPAERYNRAKDKPEIVARLKQKMLRFAEKVGAKVPGE